VYVKYCNGKNYINKLLAIRPGNTTMQPCGIILLAAGKSARMGQAKQLLVYKGKNLVRHSVEAALQASVGPVLLVTGANATAIGQEGWDAQLLVVENTIWMEGIASSIRCGLAALLTACPTITQTIFMVCDQPFVTPQLLNQLVLARRDTGKPIIACAYAGTVGTPMLFGAEFFPQLMLLQGDEGAKKLVRQYPAQISTVAFEQGAFDIDTPDDFTWLSNL